ncbi:MAG TPA: hypothetical protein VIJ94_06105 [Caulobacteraceae bacterium]
MTLAAGRHGNRAMSEPSSTAIDLAREAGGEEPAAGGKSKAKAQATQGFLDPVRDGVVVGWARPLDEATRLNVEIRIDDELVATVTADKFRKGLKKRGFNDGCYGFEWTIGGRWANGRRHQVSARAVGDSQALANSPQSFELAAASEAPPPPPARPATPSRWPDINYSDRALALARAIYTRQEIDWPAQRAVVEEILAHSSLPSVRSAASQFAASLAARRIASAAAQVRPVRLVLDAEALDREGAKATLVQWALQDGACMPELLSNAPGEVREEIVAELGALTTPRSIWSPPSEGLIVFGRPGDSFHPELSAYLRAVPAKYQAVIWDLGLQEPANPTAGEVLKRPIACAPAVLAGGLGPGVLCVKAELLDDSCRRSVSVGRFAQTKAASQPDSKWLYLPEALSATRAPGPLANTLKLWDEEDLGGGYGLKEVTRAFEVLGGSPSVVVPARRAAKIKVVLAGDNLDRLTDLLGQLSRQDVTGEVGVIAMTALSPKHIGKLLARAQPLLPDGVLDIAECAQDLSIPARFNLAAGGVAADVIIFVALETRLTSPVTLETLAAWALGREVAMVGAGPTGGGPSTPSRVRGLGLDDGPECIAVSERAWLTVGDFEPSAFPNFYGLEWALRAEDLGFVNLFCPGAAAPSLLTGKADLQLEKAMVRALHPGRLSELETIQALQNSAVRADARTALLLDRLMGSRRSSLCERQDLAVEVGNLAGLTQELREAVNVLSLKLDQGSAS